ncbi:MAG TPA: hypothetical protein VN754_07830, partial [Candidatus Binataceae bacterium]|nr:hypothetical protein [Candidatus Binataceae bacterium]
GRLLILTRGESKIVSPPYPPSSSGRRSGWIPLAQGAIAQNNSQHNESLGKLSDSDNPSGSSLQLRHNFTHRRSTLEIDLIEAWPL